MGFNCAFKCENYEGQNGKACDCPAWSSIVETNVATGEVRVNADCLFKQLPHIMVEVIKASNRPAAAIESTRNEIADGFKRLSGALPGAIAGLLEQKKDVPPG